jgi:hypothetical protein
MTRTKKLSEEEFLTIFKENCRNFSFDNDQLWRKTNNLFGDLGLFEENPRKETIGVYNYKDFFDLRKNYPVPRYKSLIGSTTHEGANYFGSENFIYLVIPFDNSNIIFSCLPDLAMLGRKKEFNFKDDYFIMEKYTKDFKVPESDLFDILDRTEASTYKGIIIKKNLGFEFFTNSNCLLISENKVEWLKNNI